MAIDHHKNLMLRQRGKGLKTCSKCGEVRGIGDFIKDRRYKDGLTNVCRACRNAYNREQYLLYREIFLKRAKTWRDNNKEKIRVHQKDYRNKNKDRLKSLDREYYKRHRTRIIEQNKKYYEDHKEACQARKKLWRIKNKEKIKEYNKKYKLEHKSASF
ncbi:unnamed protein product [marine sediment metagenome]|uniref:Uncharacterized protein n=1 Tax=marine sediment metagenome TaxID=412755 RepID=X1HFH5_9ZZZZ